MYLPPPVSDVLLKLAKSAAHRLGIKLSETAGNYQVPPGEMSSAPPLVQPVKGDPRYVDAMVKYSQRQADRERQLSAHPERANQLKEQDLQDQRQYSKLLLELLRDWQADRIQVKLSEIPTLWKKDVWFSKLSPLETVQILRSQQQQHRLLILASPLKISKMCPETFHEDLPIELPDELEKFLDQHYPQRSITCPVEFYADYFKKPISKIDVCMLQEVLGTVPTAILYTNINDYKVNFNVGFWSAQNNTVALYPLPSWNWEAAKKALEAEGQNETKALRTIRQIIVTVNQLLAAFVADWYYLNINFTYQLQLESAIASDGLAQQWVKPYIDTLREIQQQLREPYQQEAKQLLYLPTIKSFRCTLTLTGHSSWVESVAISPDNFTLVSASYDNTIKIWHLPTGELIRTLLGHTSTVYCVAISPDSKTLFSGSDDNTIKIWHLASGELIHTFPGRFSKVYSLAISPDGKTLVSGNDDRTIKIWHLDTGKLIHTLTEHSTKVHSVAISPDGKTLVSGSEDKTIKIWHLDSGNLIRTLTGHSGLVYSVAISPDGETIVSGSSDSTIIIWHLDTGELIRTITELSAAVHSVAISPDGQTLASCDYGKDSNISKDGAIQLWHLPSGELLHTLTGHSGRILSLAFSPDGKTIVSGSDDNTIKIWQCD